MASFRLASLCMCLLVCNAWVVKRQMSGCEFNTASCIQNAWIIINLFMGEGFETLVVKEHFAIDCSLQVRQNVQTCIDNNQQCTEHVDIPALKKAYNYICDKRADFINGVSCWVGGRVGDVLTECQTGSESWNYCDMPVCMRSDIAALDECSDNDGYLFGNITQIALESNASPCPQSAVQQSSA